MAYVKTETGGVTSYAECPDETAAHLQETAEPGTVVTVSDTPFLPQAKNAAHDAVKRWSTAQGITPASAPELIGQVMAARAAISVATDTAEVGAALAALTGPSAASLAVPIRRECGRRIYAVASQAAQMNMTAACAAGVLTDADKATYVASLAWVAQMRVASTAMIAAADTGYLDDAKWPACPDAVRALAARF